MCCMPHTMPIMILKVLKFVFLCMTLHLCYVHGQYSSWDPVIETINGIFKGQEMTTSDGKHYFAFKGIPYVGDQLYNSQPLSPSGSYDGKYIVDDSITSHPPSTSYKTSINGTNLTLNIYKPKSTATVKMPVVVFIDGGGSRCVQKYMNSASHILVLTSYQQGPYGFIRSSNQDESDTTIQEDKTSIYQWLEDNIVRFGGDPFGIVTHHDGVKCLNLPKKQSCKIPSLKGPIFMVKQGPIRGVIMSTRKGKNFTAFLGLPFAQPPLGNLRFKVSLPGHRWQGIFSATTQGPACLQPATNGTIIGQEDCLNLNVYVPTNAKGHLISEGLPVYVWIYGGAYSLGSNDISTYGPQRLLDTEDMIVVVPNYRVGPLGFLSTGDGAASGNQGLMDQNLALRWVKQNIKCLGGDPNRVTLGGQSAGSSSVSLHMVSSKSSGLFHRVIAQSSGTLCPYAIMLNPLDWSTKLANKFNCSTSSTRKIVNCLRKQDPRQITLLGLSGPTYPIPFVPVVENSKSGQFLTEDPGKLLQEGRFNKVPVIMGFVRDDGLISLTGGIPPVIQNIDATFFTTTLPNLLSGTTHYRTNLLQISNAIKNQYFNIDFSNQAALYRASVDMLSDIIITSWTVQSIDAIARHDTDVYMYFFNYLGDINKLAIPHAIDLVYEFFVGLGNLSSRDEAFSERYLKLLCNFIKNGNPTPSESPKWVTTTPNIHRHLIISDEFSMADGYREDDMRFWNETVPEIAAGEPLQ